MLLLEGSIAEAGIGLGLYNSSTVIPKGGTPCFYGEVFYVVYAVINPGVVTEGVIPSLAFSSILVI